MPKIEEGPTGEPVLRRYIRDIDDSIHREAYEDGRLTFTKDKEEGRLRFIAAIQHVGLVRLLQDAGGKFQFEVDADIIDDLSHYQVGIRAKDRTGELFLIRKPETDTGDLT